MKDFFKFFFASCLGVFVSIGGLLFLSIIFFIALISAFSSEEPVSISSKTVLKLQFDYPVPERSNYDDISYSSLFSESFSKNIGLNDIVKNINKAKDDDNISAIYLSLDNFYAGGSATIDPIRNALLKFKESNKPIIAHGNYISELAYYLASVADSIYLTPTGGLDFNGLNAELVFYKNTLDKLGIEAQVIRAGKFKSAGESFLYDKMSDENRKQISSFVSSIYNHLLTEISNARNIELSQVKSISENMLIQSPEEAVKYKLIDKLSYEVEVLEKLKELTGSSKLKTISLKKYRKVPGKVEAYTQNRIAVIYAVGSILGGEGSDTQIGRDNIVNSIRKARNNENVKAIVMRVNSPGGSALISDLIWKEVELAKLEKPFVVSYGSYAASGGYYISCGADKIISEPTTLTGSIGVYSIIPNVKNFFNEKLGVTFDGVKTGKYSDIMSLSRPLTASEKRILQKQVDSVYDSFLSVVSLGRDMDYDEVFEIAQGRVWTGIQGVENGLVDEIGDLQYAISSAKDLAEIEDFRIVEYPEIKKPLEELIENLQEDMSVNIFSPDVRDVFGDYSNVLKVLQSKEVQAKLPFEIEVK